jgi:hypothetical protein
MVLSFALKNRDILKGAEGKQVAVAANKMKGFI